MTPFASIQGPLALLDRNNVDTDAILPKQFMKSINRSGFGPHAFDEWRYLDAGELGMDCSKRPLNPDFELNQPRFQQAPVLLTRANFGCGSSREHAVWALTGGGVKALIGKGFADIFYNNSAKNGLLLVTLPEDVIDRFMEKSHSGNFELTVDLEAQQVRTNDGEVHNFNYESFSKHCLLNGLDELDYILSKRDKIEAFFAKQKERQYFNTAVLEGH